MAAMSRVALAADEQSGRDQPSQSLHDEESEAGELAKAVQNPIADLISVPFQNNTNYNVGPNERAQNTLNIQPVIPLHLSKSIMLITRTILPIVYQPDTTSTVGGSSGLGDLNPAFFFSPANPGKVMYGAGPIFSIPTATQRATGSGKWCGQLLFWQVSVVRSHEKPAFAPWMPSVVPTVTIASPPLAGTLNLTDLLTTSKSNDVDFV